MLCSSAQCWEQRVTFNPYQSTCVLMHPSTLATRAENRAKRTSRGQSSTWGRIILPFPHNCVWHILWLASQITSNIYICSLYPCYPWLVNELFIVGESVVVESISLRVNIPIKGNMTAIKLYERHHLPFYQNGFQSTVGYGPFLNIKLAILFLKIKMGEIVETLDSGCRN